MNSSRLMRLVPLTGVVFAALALAGNTSIGPFPDENTPIAKLTAFYSTHHAGVERGGVILYWSTLCLAVFALALWVRIRQSSVHPLVAGAALLGTALTAADSFAGAGTYSLLGAVAAKPTLAPSALQALHVTGAGGSPITGDGGLMLLLLAVAVAGIGAHAFPRWLAWSALPLALLQLTPFGFYADLVFWLWAAAAGIYMAIRPAASLTPSEASAAALLAGASS